jgi:PAS domain S-box-containing protein
MSLHSEGRLLEVNQAWEETFRYKREEVLGRFIGDFHVSGQEEKLREGLLTIALVKRGRDRRNARCTRCSRRYTPTPASFIGALASMPNDPLYFRNS